MTEPAQTGSSGFAQSEMCCRKKSFINFGAGRFKKY
jgi:hypothetical protein